MKQKRVIQPLSDAASRGTKHGKVVRVTNRTIHSSRKVAKHAVRHTKKVAAVGVAATRATHRQVAGKPHAYLMDRSKNYARWHNWPHHRHIHAAAMAVYLLVVLSMVFSSYQQAFASDLTETWDFTTPSDFTLDSGIETSGTSARFSAQNYSTDADTAALYHLDEPSGTDVSDDSGNNNDATASGAAFTTGNLNNALDFDGVNDRVVAPDSASLSLTQSNTLEAWTKLDNSFSAGSTSQRQGVIEKGDYSLYYDNETGKLTYELANDDAAEWTRVAGLENDGSWDYTGHQAAQSTTVMNSDVYVGLGIAAGDAEVWQRDGTTWSKIGGDAVNSSWADQTFEYVSALSNDGTYVYAGLASTTGDAEVWRWDGVDWTKIGGDAVNSSWAVSTFEQVWDMTVMGGNVYAGIGTTANDAEVWRWNGTAWTKIGGDSLNSGWTTNYEIVGDLTNDGSNVYAGLGTTAGDAEVWRWNGSAWTKIGGDATNSSWNTGYETIRSMAYSGSTLYAGLGDSAADAEVWAFTGGTWSQIGGDGLSSSWTTNYEYVQSLVVDGSDVYAGLASSDGDGEVYRYSSGTWSKIGGDGVNSSWASAVGDIVYSLSADSGTIYAATYNSAGGSYLYSWNGSTWTAIGGQHIGGSWGYYGMGSVEVMFAARGNLYAGTGSAAGSAQVWEYDGSDWDIVGGQGVNSSWAADTFENVTSMNSYGGNLVVGLGSSANDAEVWSYNGTSWTQIGGDSLNSGWATNFEEVNALASYGGYLYAGIGISANDAEVWRWNGTLWSKIGGDSLNSGWTTNFDRVSSMAIYDGYLHVGLGLTATEAEVWRWNGSNAWSKIGGDGVSSSWNTSYEQVETMIAYRDKLYAGLGNSTGDSEIWEYDGSTWSQIGGDDINGSWTTGTYENVRAFTVYNGDLYVGIGNTTGDGEVWVLADGAWTKIGGNSLNGGWGSAAEEVESMSVYNGKLYAGTGNTANADPFIWSWGDNGFLQSATASFDTNWHHVAATYNGTTMKLYIDGVLDNSTGKSLSMPDTAKSLRIGSTNGGREQGKAQGYFEGLIDEVRISDTARSSFTTEPYTTTQQTITLDDAAFTSGVQSIDTFVTDETTNGGTITYRLSNDGGTTWQYWNGSDWAVSDDLAETNSAAVINTNIITFDTDFDGLIWQAVLDGDGSQQVTLNEVEIEATSDAIDPSTNADNILAFKSNGGSSLASNDWTNGSSPYFSWDAGADAGAGIYGYCLYLGQTDTADPVSTKGLLGTSPTDTGGHCQYVVTSAELDAGIAGTLETALSSSSSPYYLNIKAIDAAGNVFNDSEQFQFRFDNTNPSNPGYVSAPAGFINTKDATLTWPTVGGQAASDGHSGLAGLQYRIGSGGVWYGDSHTGTGDSGDLLANDGSYQTVDPEDYDALEEGTNTIYFRTWDAAGNVTTSYVTAALKINTAGAPSEPQNVDVTPDTNTANSFAFSWDPPATFVGDEENLEYCYTINVEPSESACTYTSAGVTSLGAGPYATQPEENTFYIAARDESSNINYDSYSTVEFEANTPSPGIPTAVDIVDVSIKSTSNWRLALTWEPPTYEGAGISSYKIYRSTDESSYTLVGSSSSTTYIDAGLSQTEYFYRVRACDSTNNCSAESSTVSMIPTGKFTEPAEMTAEPEVSDITTTKATIDWSTDRTSDSKVAIGTKSGQYGSSEVGNSDQVTAHSIDLENLAAGTTYYFVVKWTDEDGNIGTSQEYTFTTSPAPVVKEIETTKIGLNSAVVKFTVKGAVKANLYFGESDGFGGLESVNTSLAESTYSVEMTGLSDGTKYFYKIGAFDSEGTEYEGNIFSFSTPPRPQIENLRFEPIEGEPTSTQMITWETNVPTTSTVTYGKVGTNGIDAQDSDFVTDHKIIIRGLEDDSLYFIVAQSRDRDGNLATSDQQTFRTALDTRPPKISDVSIESSIRGLGAEARGQVIVSWKSDEPSTSQVQYGEGLNSTNFNSKTTEDTQLTTSHLVVVSDLPTSRVFSIQPVSRDKAGNAGVGATESAIIGRPSESALTVILNTLQRIFGL